MNKKGILLGSVVKIILILLVIFIVGSAFAKVVSIGKSGVNTGIGFLDNLLSSKGSPIKDVSFSFENGKIILNTNFKENFKGLVKTKFSLYSPSNSNNPIKIGENAQDFSKSDKKEVKINIPLDHFKNDLFSKLEIEILDESKKEENTNPKVLYKETYYVIHPQALEGKSVDDLYIFILNLLNDKFFDKIAMDKLFSSFTSACYSNNKDDIFSKSLFRPLVLYCYSDPNKPNDITEKEWNSCKNDFLNKKYFLRNAFSKYGGPSLFGTGGFCKELFVTNGPDIIYTFSNDASKSGCYANDKEGSVRVSFPKPRFSKIDVYLNCDYNKIPGDVQANVVKTKNDGDFIFIKKTW